MRSENRALTGIRGVGALVIVIYHYGKIKLDHVHEVWPLPHGYMAVDLFFVLSGYVMALSYANAFTADPLREYATMLIKRVARLYPAYAVISVLYIAQLALHWAGDPTLARFGLYDAVGNALMLTGWGLSVYPLIGVSWAASAQLGAYMLFPLLMETTLRRGPLLWVASAAAAAFAICAVGHSNTGYSGPLDVVDVRSILPMVRTVAGFTLGLALARYAGLLDRLGSVVLDVLLGLTLVAIVAAMVLTRNDFPLYALLVALVGLLSRGTPLAERLFGNRVFYALGTVSYCIYLLHQLFLRPNALLARYFGASELAYTLTFTLFFVVIWGCSYAIWRFAEEPGRKLLTAWLRPAAGEVVAARSLS